MWTYRLEAVAELTQAEQDGDTGVAVMLATGRGRGLGKGAVPMYTGSQRLDQRRQAGRPVQVHSKPCPPQQFAGSFHQVGLLSTILRLVVEWRGIRRVEQRVGMPEADVD